MEVMMIPKKRPCKDIIRDHLWGPTGSFIFHALIVFALIKFVSFKEHPVVDTVQIMRIEPNPVKVPPPPDQESSPTTENPIPNDEKWSISPKIDQDPPAAPSTDEPSPQNEPLESVTPVSLITINILTLTRSAGEKDKRLSAFGANPATKQALIRALEFLKITQDKNGSWENSVGLTGLGVLTFLAHGETPSSEAYGTVVENALKYLMGMVKEDGRFNTDGGHAYVYHHAIGAYGLTEAYSMTRIPALKPIVEKSIRVIVENQMPSGGWSYGYDPRSDRNDSSVAAWQIQALKAASIAGIRIDGLEAALVKAPEGLQELYLPDTGHFGYSTQNKRTNPGLTGLGVLCHQMVGRANDPVVKNALRALSDLNANWGPQPGWPLYSWYYVTQAKFHHGGEPWKRWNALFAPTLLKNQHNDGSWTSPSDSENDRGKTYGTTLAALTLQVYYRFLPTFQEKALATPLPNIGKSDVEIHLEI